MKLNETPYVGSGPMRIFEALMLAHLSATSLPAKPVLRGIHSKDVVACKFLHGLKTFPHCFRGEVVSCEWHQGCLSLYKWYDHVDILQYML